MVDRIGNQSIIIIIIIITDNEDFSRKLQKSK